MTQPYHSVKLSDLTYGGQTRVRRFLEDEQAWWDRVDWWHGRATATQARMGELHDAFCKFKAAVEAGEPIPEAFLQWSGSPITVNKGVNVPQMRFLDAWREADRLLREANEA